MTTDLWAKRWANWTDKELSSTVYSLTPGPNEKRFEHYSRTILTHIRPSKTLDIGGGTGGLGTWLPGEYTVMDHPRMQQFMTNDLAKFLPIGPITEKYDLVVNTNSWSETSVDIIKAYLDQIEALEIPYLYLFARKNRQVPFHKFPLENWTPIVRRPQYGQKFVEFLGKLK